MQQLVLRELAKDGEQKAVIANGATVARMLGYADGVHSTPVTCISVFANGLGREFHICHGSYASATFAHACCTIEGVQRGGGEEVKQVRSVTINSVLLDFMRQYMGQQIMAEAEDPNGDLHPFVRAMLAAEGGTLLISFEKRKDKKKW